MRRSGLVLLFGLLAATGPSGAMEAMPAGCHYDLWLNDPAALVLDVEGRCDQPVAFDRPGGAGMAAALEQFEPGADGRSISYRLRLGDLADLAGSPDIAQRIDGAVVSPLSVWLADNDLPEAGITLAFTVAPGLDIAHALPEHDSRLHLKRSDIRFGGYAVFGRFDRSRIALPGAEIGLVRFPGRPGPEDALLRRWIADSAAIVETYFGRFPLSHSLIVAVPAAGRSGVVFGRVRGGGGGSVLLRLGEAASRAELHDDWILVHEMIHLGAPFITGRSAWLMEGMATYIEPVIRTRAGWRSAEQLWEEFASQMPRGVEALTVESLNAVTRRGLYWGGAIFMLLADLDIRERSHGRAALETCLRAVLQAGGDTTVRWPRQRFLDTCDAATGTGTMDRLVRLYVTQASPLDLEGLWHDLGVALGPAGVTFDDTAPHAALRRAITEGR